MRYDYIKPTDIERRSFEIIADELQSRGLSLRPEQAPVVLRCIHTSADFDYATSLYFSHLAVEKIQEVILSGCSIVTDTQMAMAGINKQAAKELGIELFCFMADADVAKEAQEREVTRALVAMEKALSLQNKVIFAIGNAPTALMRLYEAINRAGFSPAGIVAAPVGFVNVVESKELIMQTEAACIVARGRKGGSNIAAAICNALLYSCRKVGRE